MYQINSAQDFVFDSFWSQGVSNFKEFLKWFLVSLFYGLNFRSDLFTFLYRLGRLLVRPHNGLRLQEVGDFEDENCLPPKNLIRSTKLHLTTEPPISCRCCYMQFFSFRYVFQAWIFFCVVFSDNEVARV